MSRHWHLAQQSCVDLRSEKVQFRPKACLFALTTLASCAEAPADRMAKVGPYPTGYEQIVTTFFHDYLPEPNSAKYQAVTPPFAMFWGGIFTGYKYGWRVCVTLDAKDERGVFTGFQTDALMIRNGRVIDYFPRGIFAGMNACNYKPT